MKTMRIVAGLLCCASLAAAEPSLTIYSNNFAVVRDLIPLTLEAGENTVSYNHLTAHLEPDSVILRDPAGQRKLSILEQNYRADPISQELLLSYYEGQTINFMVSGPEGMMEVPYKIVRSGYVRHDPQSMRRYGQDYYMAQSARGNSEQLIVESSDGKLRFGLPGGIPLFPQLPDDSILKPTLNWKLETDQAGPLEAELSYVTGGMSWEADYNLVSPETADAIQLVGWVTLDNQSGLSFENAKLKLVAGDVSKISPDAARGPEMYAGGMGGGLSEPRVTEKAFDEYHLYTLARPVFLRDRETKQVEFTRAEGIASKRIYEYDGALINWQRYGSHPNWQNYVNDRNFGADSTTKVAVMREFANTPENHLGMPLPAGRVRFYRQDSDGQLEMTGENTIDHTPVNETLRVFTGNAFDLVGERKQINHINQGNMVDESFEIKVRNHKKEPVEVTVVEHMYRCPTWNILMHSDEYTKTSSDTIKFAAQIPADGEKVITYSVHYSW